MSGQGKYSDEDNNLAIMQRLKSNMSQNNNQGFELISYVSSTPAGN